MAGRSRLSTSPRANWDLKAPQLSRPPSANQLPPPRAPYASSMYAPEGQFHSLSPCFTRTPTPDVHHVPEGQPQSRSPCSTATPTPEPFTMLQRASHLRALHHAPEGLQPHSLAPCSTWPPAPQPCTMLQTASNLTAFCHAPHGLQLQSLPPCSTPPPTPAFTHATPVIDHTLHATRL